ncbi:uncharacterized protein [Aegilops tauschii subsp. strangulata]|nr:uncharacterized protein LOC109779454 isoform X1 [Aegilops tauschii subsp. strangulata]
MAAVSHSPPPAADRASFPDWVMLDRFVVCKDEVLTDGGDSTMASGSNSRGHKFHVGFQLHAPPQVSRILLRVEGGASVFDDFHVVAAHRDALLLQMSYVIDVPRPEHTLIYKCRMIDFFLYRAGGGGSSPPSLRLLPTIGGTEEEVRARIKAEGFFMTNQCVRRAKCLDVGVLCRGDDEFAVAELQITWSKKPPELHIFCPSRSNRWEFKQPPVILIDCQDDISLEDLLFHWDADMVVPFGSYLCWVDYCRGIMFCNVFDDSPEILFLNFPAKVPNLRDNCHSTGWVDACQTVGVTSCGAMKFVTVVRSDGQIIGDFKGSSDFTVTSWTLRITELNKMTWDKTDELTSNELWSLDGFASTLPRTPLQFPVISMNDPNVLCFVLGQRVAEHCYYDHWSVSVDISRKTIKGFFPYVNPELEETDVSCETKFSKAKYWYFESFLPAEFSKHLNLLSDSARLYSVLRR